MDSDDEEISDCLSNIDLSGEYWATEVFLQCPGLALCFPVAILEGMQIPLELNHKEMPDGKSFDDWISHPRPTLLLAGENQLYPEFHEWWWNVWANAYEVLTPDDSDEDLTELVVDDSERIREMLSNEQLVRFHQEFRRKFTYDNIRAILRRDMRRLEALKEFLEPLAEELQTYLDDQMEDFAWPEENRKEDAALSAAQREGQPTPARDAMASNS